MRILIIRHGDPDYSVDGLTERGHHEADLLAEKLKKETDDMTQAAEGFLLAASRLEGTAAKTLEGAGKALSDTASGLAGQVNEARQKLDRDMDESLAYFEGCMTQVMKHVEKAARQVEKAASALPAGKKNAGGDA